jgi:transcriptional regulator with XRE-family HTH domain
MKTLKQLRQDTGVTQEELARRIQGIRGGKAFQGPVSAIERNRNSPTMLRVRDYLTSLGFELKVLAVREGVETELDLRTMLGTEPSRAKDAGEPAAQSEPVSPPDTTEPVNQLAPIQDPLESLLLGILKK